MKLEMTINGVARTLEAAADARLADVLRGAGYLGVKQGCHDGTCGSCVVLVDGRAMSSCILLAGQAHGRSIETVEGLGNIDAPHPLQQAFVDEAAVQCGFCTPGMLMSAKALLDQNPDPTDAEIVRALDGNLCRCTGYTKIISGVKRAASILRGES